MIHKGEIFEARVKPLGGSMGEHREHPKLILFEVVHPDSYCILRRRQRRREDMRFQLLMVV